MSCKQSAQEVGKGYLASFISHGAGRAIFIGLYRIDAAKPITFDEYWAIRIPPGIIGCQQLRRRMSLSATARSTTQSVRTT